MQLILNDSTIDHLSQFAPSGQWEVVKNWLIDLQNRIPITDETYWVLKQILSSTELQKTLDSDKHTIDILNVLHLRRLIESRFSEAINWDTISVHALTWDIGRILKNDASKYSLNWVSIGWLLGRLDDLQKQAKQQKVASDLYARKESFLRDFQSWNTELIEEVTHEYPSWRVREWYIVAMNDSTIASIDFIRSIPEGTTVFEIDDFIEDIEVVDRFWTSIWTYIFIKNEKNETEVVHTACPPIPRIRNRTSLSIRATYLWDVQIHKYDDNCQVIHERWVNIFFDDGKKEITHWLNVRADSCVFIEWIDNSHFIQAETLNGREIYFISCKTGRLVNVTQKWTLFEVINGVVTLPQVGFRKNKPNPWNFELHN